MWASTRCPFCSSTRNIALGSGSTTRPSTSMAPSFFATPTRPPRSIDLRAPMPEPAGRSYWVQHRRRRWMVVRAISQRAPDSLRPQQDDGRRERHRPLYYQGHPATNPPSGDGGDVLASLTRADPERCQAGDAAVLGGEHPGAVGG